MASRYPKGVKQELGDGLRKYTYFSEVDEEEKEKVKGKGNIYHDVYLQSERKPKRKKIDNK